MGVGAALRRDGFFRNRGVKPLLQFSAYASGMMAGMALASALWLPARSNAAEPADASAQIAALDRAIMMRPGIDGKIYGEGEIDPLLWRSSDYFLSGSSRLHLIATLEALNRLSDADVRRCPPTQRALVQNRVWTVFDHVQLHAGAQTPGAPVYIRVLAQAMAKLALDQAEIATIADPLVAAANSGDWPAQPTSSGGADVFLPAQVAAETGPWISLGREDGEVMARHHVRQFGGRSLFFVRVKFPPGVERPEAYFKAVADFPNPWLSEGAHPAQLNPALPELPAGAEFALIRRLAVVDRAGHWRATPLTLTVQLRRYRITNQDAFQKFHATVSPDPRSSHQSFAEFELDTSAVAAGQAARWHAVRREEKRFMFLFSHDVDQVDGAGDRFPDFQPGPPVASLQICANCHSGLGLKSVNSLTIPFGAPALWLDLLSPHRVDREAGIVATWKSQRADWGALQVLWPAPEMPVPVH